MFGCFTSNIFPSEICFHFVLAFGDCLAEQNRKDREGSSFRKSSNVILCFSKLLGLNRFRCWHEKTLGCLFLFHIFKDAVDLLTFLCTVHTSRVY